MLVILTLSSKESSFPTDALSVIDTALATKGLRKQVRSAVVRGKQYATTYECSSIEKSQVESVVSPLAERYGITFVADIEESVSFP